MKGMACLLLASLSMAWSSPHLLFITVDDMNCDSVGAFGGTITNLTPHLDRLAEEGLCFERAHVNVAICQPTRAVWMTGRYSHRNGALGFNAIRPEVPTLPEALHQAGYLTALLGKVPHVVPTRHAAFDVITDSPDLGRGRDPEAYRAAVRGVFQRARKEGKPFFLMANAHDPHRPFAGSDQETWRPRPSVRRTISMEEAVLPGFLPDLPEIRRELAEYYTSVHRADEVVGAILEELDRAGLKEETLVLFMSDHGMPLPFAKTNCYLDSTRTPWIVRWPGVVKAGRRDRDHFVSGIDVAPTLLEAAGLPTLPGADGRSILPLLRGEKQEGRESVFTMINRIAGGREYTMRAVQNDRYLYIWNGWADGQTVFRNESQSGRTMKAMLKAAPQDPAIQARVQHFLHRCREELYDLRNDPACRQNLLRDKSAAWSGQHSAFTKQLWHWMKQTGDPQRTLFEQQVELALD